MQAEYFDYQGANGHIEAGPPSSFVRPLNLADRKSGTISYNSRGSGATGLTYATDGSAPIREEPRHTPPQPIRGMPSPIMRSNGLHPRGVEEYDDEEDEEEDEEEEDDDPEYMMVDADLSMVSQFGGQNQPPSAPGFHGPPPKVMNNKPVPVKVQGGRKGFVGGFFSGLRRLPRLLRNQRGQTVHRQPSHDTVLELPGFGEDSPGYDPFRAQPPSFPQPVPHRPPTIPSILHHPSTPQRASIPASRQVTSMHYSQYTHDEQTEPTERSETPNSRDPRDFDSEELEDGHGHSGSEDEEDDRPSTLGRATLPPSARQSRYSHRSTHLSAANHPPRSDHNSKSNHSSAGRQSPHHSHSPPQTALDGDTTLIHQTQNGEPDAVAVNPLPTSDYKSMVPESSSSSSASSVVAGVGKIQQFISDVYNLPWVATQVTVDFVPDRDGRRYRGTDPNAKRVPETPKTWYPSLHKNIDLLEGENQPQAPPVMAHRRQDGHRRALTESTVTPTSAAVTQSVTPSTTYSPRRYSVNSEPPLRHHRHTRDFRHTHRHRRRHRDHSRPHSPPLFPLIASPPPVYLVPGHASPPHIMPIPQPAVAGSSASSPKRAISPAGPFYMLSMSPVYQPMSGFPYVPPPQPAHSPPKQPQPAQTQTTPPQPAANPPVSS